MRLFIFSITILAFIACLFLSARRRIDLLLIIYIGLSPIVLSLYSIYSEVNYFGFGKAWSFLEIFQIFLILYSIKSFISFNNKLNIDYLIIIFCFLILLAFIMGYFRRETINLYNVARGYLFLPIYFVAVKLFIDEKKIQRLLDSILLFTIFIFLYHILIAFNIIILPATPEVLQLVIRPGEVARVEWFMAPGIYLISLSIAIYYMFFLKIKLIFSRFIYVISILGILMSQTRSYYLGLIVIISITMMMVKKKGRILYINASMIIIIFLILYFSKVDIFYRFKYEKYRPKDSTFQGYMNSFRGLELASIFNEYKKDLPLLLAGRGFGATHEIPGYPKLVTYVHNEFLKTLNYFGLTGLLCYLFILIIIFRSYLRALRIGHIDSMFIPVYTCFFASLFLSQFASFIWNNQTGPILFCFLAVLRNQIYNRKKLIQYKNSF